MTAPSNSLKWRFAAATALALLASAWPSPAASAAVSSVDAQGNLFVQTSTVEFGASANGHFGSCFGGQCATPPAGYHANSQGLGFMVVRDPITPSWTNALGDFFAPGDPYEGWVLTADGEHAENSNSKTSIPGSWKAPSSTDSSWVWTATSAWHGLSVQQTVTPVPGTTQINIAVQLTNTSTDPVAGIAYGRVIDPDNCAVVDDDFDTVNRIGAQTQLSEGKAVVTASKTCDSLGNPYSTMIGLATRSAGSVANNDVTDFDPALDLASDPIDTGSVAEGDSAIAIAIPAKPSAGDTLAPGASVTLTFTYVMNSNDLQLAGLDGPDPLMRPVLADAGYKLASTGYLGFIMGGSAGRTYEISTSSSFTKPVAYASGASGKFKITQSGFGKGKVGRTTFYIRDKLIPTNSYSFTLPWDFALPTVKSGSVRPTRDSLGKIIAGKWTLGFTAADVSTVGAARGLWAEISYGTATPSATKAFPAALLADNVIPVQGTTYSVLNATRPVWVRVADAFGNRSSWLKLTSLARTSH